MAETTKTFTTEERIAFEEKYNLWVYSHEAMIELLMQQDKKIQQLEERLMEVARKFPEETIIYPDGTWFETQTLADKWK